MSRELIGLVEIFDGCNSNFLDSISVLLHEVNIAPDNVLFRANEVSRELYIVASGMMQLLVESDDAGVIVQNVRSAGQVCPVDQKIVWCLKNQVRCCPGLTSALQ